MRGFPVALRPPCHTTEDFLLQGQVTAETLPQVSGDATQLTRFEGGQKDPLPLGTRGLSALCGRASSMPQRGRFNIRSKYLVSVSCAPWDISRSSLPFSLLSGCHKPPALGFHCVTRGLRHRTSMCPVFFLRGREVRGVLPCTHAGVFLGERLHLPPPFSMQVKSPATTQARSKAHCLKTRRTPVLLPLPAFQHLL